MSNAIATVGIRYTNHGYDGIYYGELQNGIPHGRGVIKFANGDLYAGEWRNGSRHGFGIAIDNNDKETDTYIGAYADNLRNGQGTYYYSHSGQTHSGMWKDNHPI